MPRTSPLAVGLVLGAASFWGVGSLFTHAAITHGLAPAQVALYANVLSLAVLAAALLVRSPQLLRVRPAALPGLLAVGLCGSGLAFFCYTNAMQQASLGLSTVLMYTSPAWVVLLGWRFLGEQIAAHRAGGVLAACVGVALVSQLYDPAAVSGSLTGVLFGLAGGLAYGFFIVLSKRALRRHHPLTVTIYSFAGAALVLLPLQGGLRPIGIPAVAWEWLALYVASSQIIGNVAYNSGLRRVRRGWRVSILALWSPITTVTLSVLILGETFSPLQALGALLVIGSVVAMTAGAQPSESTAATTTAVEPAGPALG